MGWIFALLLIPQSTIDFERSATTAIWEYSDGSLAVVVAAGHKARRIVTEACGTPCSSQWVGEVWYQGNAIPALTATPRRSIRPSGIGIWDFGGGNLLVIVPAGHHGERLLEDVCRNCALRYMGQLWLAKRL